MSEKQSVFGFNTRPITISIAVIGVITIMLEFQEIGLTLIAVAGLFAAAEFILDRLRRIGVEKLAFGSLLIGIGFTLLAVLVIGFAWSLFADITGVYLTIAGLVLMILGYTTEYYDLNMRLIAFYQKVTGQLSEMFDNFRRRYLKSPWAVIIYLLLIYLIISYFYPIILLDYELGPLNFRMIIILLIVIFLVIEFREFVKFGIIRIIELLGILLLGIWKRLRNLPDLVITFFRKLWAFLLSFLNASWSFVTNIPRYVKNFFVGMYNGLVQFRRRYLTSIWITLFYLSCIYFIVSLIIPSIQEPLKVIPLNPWVSQILIAILFYSIDKRKSIWRAFVKFYNSLKEFLSIIYNWIKLIPTTIWNIILGIYNILKWIFTGLLNFFKAIPKFFRRVFERIVIIFNYLGRNTFFIGFTSFGVFGILSLTKDDSILGGFSVVLLIISLSLLMLQRGDTIGRRIRQTQQSAYQTSFRIRAFFKRKKFTTCQNCQSEIKEDLKFCNQCGNKVPSCMICKFSLKTDEEYEQCAKCQYFYHSEHIQKWTEIMPNCPVCREEWVSMD